VAGKDGLVAMRTLFRLAMFWGASLSLLALTVGSAAAAPPAPNPANYTITRDCTYNAVADTSQCDFTASVANNDRGITSFTLTDPLCTALVDTNGRITRTGLTFQGTSGSAVFPSGIHEVGTATYEIKAKGSTVSITGPGIGCNAAPVTGDDTASTTTDTATTISVLGNDTDADGDALVVTGVGTPANGIVVVNADGTITYTPATGFVGTDSFTYTISDGFGGSDSATVQVTVTNPPTTTGVLDVLVVRDGAGASGVSFAVYRDDCAGALVAAGVTDTNGRASITLAAGTYCLEVDPGTGSTEQEIIGLSAGDPPGDNDLIVDISAL
jgi:hypothetical protein